MEGFLRYRFGGLISVIFGGAYFMNLGERCVTSKKRLRGGTSGSHTSPSVKRRSRRNFFR